MRRAFLFLGGGQLADEDDGEQDGRFHELLSTVMRKARFCEDLMWRESLLGKSFVKGSLRAREEVTRLPCQVGLFLLVSPAGRF